MAHRPKSVTSVAVTSETGASAPTTVTMGQTLKPGAKATYWDKTTGMATQAAVFHSSDTGKATIQGNVLTPVAPGETRVTATLEGRTSPEQTIAVQAAE